MRQESQDRSMWTELAKKIWYGCLQLQCLHYMVEIFNHWLNCWRKFVDSTSDSPATVVNDSVSQGASSGNCEGNCVCYFFVIFRLVINKLFCVVFSRLKEFNQKVINEAIEFKSTPVQYLISRFHRVMRCGGIFCVGMARSIFIGCLRRYLNELKIYGLPHFGSLVIGKSLRVNEPVQKKTRVGAKTRRKYNRTPNVTESQYVSVQTKQFTCSTELFHLTHSITEYGSGTERIRHQDTEETMTICGFEQWKLLNDGPVGILQTNDVAVTDALQVQMIECGGTGNGSNTTTISLPSNSNETNPIVETPKPQFYTEVLVTYAAIIGDSVKILNTNLYARLPMHNKYMVENGIIDSLSCGRDVKRVTEEMLQMKSDDELMSNIDYKQHRRCSSTIKYGSGSATSDGKGGNGFALFVFHEKEYEIKVNILLSDNSEVNFCAALQHKCIVPFAIIQRDRHLSLIQKILCGYFMFKMHYGTLPLYEIGCLKQLYLHCFVDLVKTSTGNAMIRMRCKCNPLYCNCSSKFQVKLGDFDSAGTVPGLGIKEPTDQMIKFASILPLGTPGYRAPEVSMHITLSGPYETLYTFAVDMWSFGCLCLNICIGKTAALRQREEASLLLSTTLRCSKKLWKKATKECLLLLSIPHHHIEGLCDRLTEIVIVLDQHQGNFQRIHLCLDEPSNYN